MKCVEEKQKSSRIYADWAATTPLCQRAKDAMLKAMEVTGNPSSVHTDGQQARELAEKARTQVAALINAEPSEIYFTSGATEANVWALKGFSFPLASAIEHKSVLSRPGRFPRTLPVNQDGLVYFDHRYSLVEGRPNICSVMAVNNETGVIQDVESLCKEAHERNMWFHTDATQAVGHIPVDVKKWGCDMLSMSAHKFGGPKGVGALFIRDGVSLPPMLYGGGQEGGLRAGTENVIGIAGMGAAAEFCKAKANQVSNYMEFLTRRIAGKVLSLEGVLLAGENAPRSPSICDFLFEGVEGPTLVLALDKRNVSASSGSACSEGVYGPSHVLKAMGMERYGSLRVSIGWSTTVEEADYIAEAIIESVRGLRK